MLSHKEIFGIFSVTLALIGYVPYFIGILKGNFRPHIFSWFIWGIVLSIVTLAQIVKGGGPGVWATGITCIASVLFTIFGFKHGKKDITRSDWILLFLSLVAIALWQLTHDPMWSVILSTVINLMAFYPTFRKAYHKPLEESAFSWGVNCLKFGLALFALERFNITTALFPAVVFTANGLLTALILWRRKSRNNPSYRVI